MPLDSLDTAQKALQINRDAKKYGTFAEIGAGQEVARWFFHVGGASRTVAKTMSAYDMAISDAVYGPTKHYVSRQRLQSMLDHEYRLLLERLETARAEKSTFFVFANSVATHRRASKEPGQGWLGMRFQTHPGQQPSEILIHVKMHDAESVREQEALGIVGVNLIFGAFYTHDDPPRLIASLKDGLSDGRIEIDLIKFSGPCFAAIDNRLMALQLVEQQLTDATLFTAEGETVIPSEVLFQKPVLVERGSFRPMTNLMLDMLERAQNLFAGEGGLAGEPPVVLLEMTLNRLQSEKGIDHQDFLDRVDTLCALGKTVLISRFFRYHRLVTYLSQHTQKMIGLPLGLTRLRDVLNEQFYADLQGGLMESLGQLFKNRAKLYVYPALDGEAGAIMTAENLQVAPNLRHLYAHLLENHFVESIRDFKPELLKIFPQEVLAEIRSGDSRWEKQVPPPIAEVIKRKQLFGYRGAP